MKFKLILGGAGLLLAASAAAVTCMNNIPASNPDSAYTVHGDGTATDIRTGLMWKVCAEGQTWSAGACTGSAGNYTWEAALSLAEASSFAAYNDWRLPSIRELRSLVEECRHSPSINDSIFPSTPSNGFFSGSPNVAYPSSAWVVDFIHGNFGSVGDRTYGGVSVRIVRGGGVRVPTFSLANDFSATSNPNGAWSYGWAASLGQSFQLDAGILSGVSGGLDYWIPSTGLGYPYIVHNTTASEITYSSAVYAPNAVVLHPGNQGEVAIARWTASTAGIYSVVARFGGAEAGLADILVLKNGATQFQALKSSTDPYLLSPIAWSGEVDLAAGDTIDFVVGYGGDGHGRDSTRVDVSIWEQ